MTHPFFDADEYPWDRPEGGEFHRALYRAVDEPNAIRRLYATCGSDLPPLASGAADAMWQAALQNLAKNGLLGRLCEVVEQDRLTRNIAGLQAARRAVVGASGSLLDATAYPWSEGAAQRLYVTLVRAYPIAAAALSLARRSGLNPATPAPAATPADVWRSVLEEAARTAQTRRLVETAKYLLGPGSPAGPVLDDVLAGRRPRDESEPLGPGGPPPFLSGGNTVGEQEALLYRDDLTIPVRQLRALIATLERLAAAAPAVCLLQVQVGAGQSFGTGFRVGPKHVLTNWHVLHNEAGARASAVTAEFGFEEGSTDPSQPVDCDPVTITGDEKDDWAVIAAVPLNDAWPILSLADAADPSRNDAAYIIQHPGGLRKRVGFVRNQVTDFDDRVVHYLTDTQEGSSGSPVLNANGKLIALHRAGGLPQEIVGKPPVKKNEGVRISRILAGLRDRDLRVM